MASKSGTKLSPKSSGKCSRMKQKIFKIFSEDSKKCVIIEGFADRGEDDKTEDSLMAAKW